MEKITGAERERLNKLGREYLDEWRKEREKALKMLSPELAEFMHDCRMQNNTSANSALASDLKKGLAEGRYQKPSDFFRSRAEGLFGGVIYSRRREEFYHTVDNVHQLAYSTSMWRRSFRSKNPDAVAERVMAAVYSYCERDHFDADICDILEEKNLSEKQLGHLSFNYYNQSVLSDIIAAEIDFGNERLINIVKNALCGDSEVSPRLAIIGTMQSHNSELHELLGKLLLAARLQEGLRQVICENMDCAAVPEAFTLLLDVIMENNLIRFSSVKRAVGTWLGLINTETDKIERISDKSIELISECIKDPAVREEYLSSEDSMKIYIVLWSYGFYEAEDMLKKIEELSANGTHHQILTAGYAAINLDNKFFMHKIAKPVIKRHKNEQDILAMYIPCFMPDHMQRIHSAVTGKLPGTSESYIAQGHCSYSCYFGSSSEAEKYFEILSEILGGIKGKTAEFSPCVFPWHSAVLFKSDIICRLAFIADSLRDNDKIDGIVTRLPEIDASGISRSKIIRLLLSRPETETQRRVLAEEVCDKESWSREAAFKIIQETEITPENYLRLEEMLKYKNSEMRSNLITLLMKQNDDSLFGSVSRLLSDKKEEKRTAALDIIMQLSKDEKRKSVYEKSVPLAAAVENPSTKEKILIENITGNRKAEKAISEPLFTNADEYLPRLPEGNYVQECAALFMEYFPDSQVGTVLNSNGGHGALAAKIKNVFKGIAGTDCAAFTQAKEDLISLCECIKAHRDMEFTYNGEARTMDCYSYEFHAVDENGNRTVPFIADWEKWFDGRGMDTVRMMRLKAAWAGHTETNEFTAASEKYITALFGNGFEKFVGLDYSQHLDTILSELVKRKLPSEKWADDRRRLAFAVLMWFMKAVPDSDVMFSYKRNSYQSTAHLLSHAQIAEITGSIDIRGEYSEYYLALRYLAIQKSYKHSLNQRNDTRYGRLSSPGWNQRGGRITLSAPGSLDFIDAAYSGSISERTMYWFIFNDKSQRNDNLSDALNILSNITSAYREQGRQVAGGRGRSSWQLRRAKYDVCFFIGRKGGDADSPFTEEENKKLKFAAGVYEKILGIVLDAELNRGDSETPYSEAVRSINRIYGGKNFAAILSALGKETLERSSYISGKSKKSSLSHLLSVCIPEPEDSADSLRALIKDTDITEKRLIEAALYSPEWIDIISEYLGWEGFVSVCYYFMAHMNEKFDDKRKAVIARYTPLTEEELNLGAFDIDWFRSAHETIGEKRFDMIYTAAKYISDGAKHSRARKYADAAMGKMNPSETMKTIADKRNKDLLMAYALIPLADDNDLCERYLYLQKFLKESKKFGSQRSASEKKAVETAMRNLALNAGYSDTDRLTLRMETKLVDDSRELFEEKQIGDVVLKLSVDENGKAEILCTKGGKALKSIPAKLKKDEYVLRLSETKKALTEQYRRTRAMFEQAMESGTEFTAEEIGILRSNPVILPIIKNLLFACGNKLGFIEDGKLTDHSGKSTKLSDSDKVIAAHTFLIYKDGHWTDYQKLLYDNGTVQPFRQVFRELYVKTAEETEMYHSLRYSGNQIQPAKTVACLKSRRWVADIEDGLQKVYYKENIVARIYAMADWFTPADVEAPTLEWVEFSHRKTGKEIKIGDVPDIIFSEVMRDVDLAVSAAHAGGVDPEASHSTMEMRAALLEFTLPLFKLKNVEIKEHHAHIEGKYGDYTVHLGSGIIHKKGGSMIAVLPVHSQQRGKLFLPFADDDPKTAEIITKVLFLAEDGKIKDPAILSQIKG